LRRQPQAIPVGPKKIDGYGWQKFWLRTRRLPQILRNANAVSAQRRACR
jgi:hypothetical protein